MWKKSSFEDMQSKEYEKEATKRAGGNLEERKHGCYSNLIAVASKTRMMCGVFFNPGIMKTRFHLMKNTISID